jgi:hypothetical protein
MTSVGSGAWTVQAFTLTTSSGSVVETVVIFLVPAQSGVG